MCKTSAPANKSVPCDCGNNCDASSPPPLFFFYVKYHSSSELGTVVAVLHDSYASRFQRCYVHRTTIDREIQILTELAVYIHFLTFLGDANFLRPEIHFLEVLLQ